MHPDLARAFEVQQSPPFFPVPLDAMHAEKRFNRLETGREYRIAGFRVNILTQEHPGKSYGYSIEKDGKKVVYATDVQHSNVEGEAVEALAFYRHADLLILDAQYYLTEQFYTKVNWGHSSNLVDVELAIKAGVKHLCLFHSEPVQTDASLDKLLEETGTYARLYANANTLQISLASDGQEIEV